MKNSKKAEHSADPQKTHTSVKYKLITIYH